MAKVKIIRADDYVAVDAGLLERDRVRSLEIDMLVDTGAVMPALPEDVVEALGLSRQAERRPVRMADGTVRKFEVCDVAMEILGRSFLGLAWVLPRGTKPLLGQIPLEALDLVVVPATGEVIGNPLHPDGPILDLLSVAA